jgi:pyrimidine-specific ribonucleoside hydrolase
MPIRARLRRAVLLLVATLVAAACGSAADATVAPLVTGEPPTVRVPIIIDTDLDLSDVAALAVLLRDPQVDIRAVTIVPTGTGVTTCATGRRLLEYILVEFGATTIPLACGREDPGPDGRHFPDEWRGAADDGWGMVMPPRPQTGLAEDAKTLLLRAVDESPSAPTIVAIGPWTNLEDAIAADATIADRIAGIHAMGGAVDVGGNVIVDDVTAAAGLEWNLAADPSAVAAVLGTTTPISLVPLDATDAVPVPANLGELLATDHEAAGADLLYELLLRSPSRLADGQQLWDELAALTVSNPDLVTWDDAPLLADDQGRLSRDEAGRTVRIATTADGAAVETALLEALRRGPSRATPFVLAGKITVRWDGATCAFELTEGPVPGVVAVRFENGTGDPAGVQVLGVREPHMWPEVEALLPTLDLETAGPPDWVIDAGGLSDQAGTGVPIDGAVQLEPATYGPVCVVGSFPDLTFRAGQPFVVAAP